MGNARPEGVVRDVAAKVDRLGVGEELEEGEEVEKTAGRCGGEGREEGGGMEGGPGEKEAGGTVQSGNGGEGFSVFNTAREVRELVRVLSC